VIRLHASQIRSVAYSRSDEGASYTIKYHGGRLRVTDGMAGFPDFLARLKKLNHAVDLTSFPPDRRPGLGIPQEGGTSVGHGIRRLLFPLAVLAALIWLSIETLTTR
jgi:penicillin V acylase-like amidase (Ntn superfamily)